ncbi:MAG: DUF4249 family protein [Ignavibacteriales bacterium]|nr:DUF4249 family protein [Ignavibacteriales bacterium]
MSKYSSLLLNFLATLFLLSCNQPFDPKAPFQEQLVVFSVLSTDRNAQFVRVERNYMPPDFDPLAVVDDKAIPGAQVTVTDGLSTYRFRDTTLPRLDTSRFRSPIHAFVMSPFSPQAGKTYRFTVQTPGVESASASATIPSKSFPSMGITVPMILDSPGSFNSNEEMVFNVVLSTITRGFVGRLFLDYEVLEGSEWASKRTEVPLIALDPKFTSLKYVTYPQMIARTSTGFAAQIFRNYLYTATLSSISYDRYKSNKIIFNRVVFQVLQADKNLFNYFNVAHAYRDAQSIRLDEPMFSNVTGGTGLVGAYALDSLVHLLPEDFVYNKR